ncbi:MAG: type II toxin-antitoxin system YoeB family toxin, partial [Desulfococcaceae bacterium]
MPSSKPGPLWFELSGDWSPRLSQEHRLGCAVEEDSLPVFQCGFH